MNIALARKKRHLLVLFLCWVAEMTIIKGKDYYRKWVELVWSNKDDSLSAQC